MRARFSMRWGFRLLILFVFLGLSVGRTAQANVERSAAVTMFYTDLSPYGSWEDHPVYGKVWYPRSRDWRPYTVGYWVNTEAYGWLWIAESEWGLITEHYGRWTLEDSDQWFWVPGDVWAPAWVIWREADEEIGIAPMPPYWNPYDTTSRLGDSVDSRCWVFIHARDFPDRQVKHNHPPKTVYIDPQHYRVLLKRSRLVSQWVVLDRHIYNRGVAPERIARATGRHIVTVSPTVLSKPIELAEQEKRDIKKHGPIIYRPIDKPLTLATIHDEESRAKQFAEKITRHADTANDPAADEHRDEPQQPDGHVIERRVPELREKGEQAEIRQSAPSGIGSPRDWRTERHGRERAKPHTDSTLGNQPGPAGNEEFGPERDLPDQQEKAQVNMESPRENPDLQPAEQKAILPNGESLHETSPGSGSPHHDDASAVQEKPVGKQDDALPSSTEEPSDLNGARPSSIPLIANQPSSTPTSSPVYEPSPMQSPSPGYEPSSEPTPSTVSETSPAPTPSPVSEPSSEPTPSPVSETSSTPTPSPVYEPSPAPTPSPVYEPSPAPTPSPVYEPSPAPTPSPVSEPSPTPTPTPVQEPSPPPAPVEPPVVHEESSPPQQVESHQEATSHSDSGSGSGGEHKHGRKHHD